MKQEDWNELQNEPLFREHIKTLKECSKDDAHEEFMTESSLLAVDFDDVKTAYASKLGQRNRIAASLDAMAVSSAFAKDAPGQLVFIEFKNGVLSGKERDGVHNKVRDSVLLFCDITSKTLRYTRENVDFVLVYNKQINQGRLASSPSRDTLQKLILGLGNGEPLYFGVDEYYPFFFRQAHTYSEEEFRQYEAQLTSIV